MAATHTTLRINLHNQILLLALENPSGFPRLERDILARLSHALRSAVSDVRISGMVITGTEKSFASGAEIREVAGIWPIGAQEFSLLGQDLMKQIERSPKPILAAIHGYCMGGALDLALACHMRVASEEARFAYPGAKRGLLTGWGGTQRLARTLLPGARGRALELFATARIMDAREAYQCGLVSGVVPFAEVLTRAQALATCPWSRNPSPSK